MFEGVGFPDDFASHVQSDPEVNTGEVVAADLDGDGDQDVVLSDRFGWMENLAGSDPTFEYHPIDGPENSPFDLEVVDINFDGRLDVVASWTGGQAA